MLTFVGCKTVGKWQMADGRKVSGGGTDGYSYVARLLKKWTTGILMAILTLQGCYRRW